MKWLLLLSLFACASHRTPEPAPVPKVATESDAKPVSPYTVKPCLCMKIFQPVCSEGVSYGNSCEAECNGHKTWTEGSCKKK